MLQILRLRLLSLQRFKDLVARHRKCFPKAVRSKRAKACSLKCFSNGEVYHLGT